MEKMISLAMMVGLGCLIITPFLAVALLRVGQSLLEELAFRRTAENTIRSLNWRIDDLESLRGKQFRKFELVADDGRALAVEIDKQFRTVEVNGRRYTMEALARGLALDD